MTGAVILVFVQTVMRQGYFQVASWNARRATHDSVVFRFITADSHPGHGTMAAFHKRFLKQLEELYELPPCPQDVDLMTQQMKHRLKTKAGKALYAKRKSTVETTVFGIIKQVPGFRQFHLRGREATEGK